MHVRVVAVTGQEHSFNLEAADTVATLKSLIWEEERVPPYHQGLIFRGEQLDSDDKLLTDYGINSGSTISLALLARSGPLKVSQSSDIGTSSAAIKFDPAVSIPSSRHSDRDGSLRGELDLSFTTEKRMAAKTRAEENLRTMAKMKELRQNLERLKLEKKNRCGGAVADPANVEGPSRARKTWCSGTGNPARVKSPSSITVAPALLSAPEDTSAKESSAGETEYEEWRPAGPVLLREDFCRQYRASPDKEKIGHCASVTDNPLLKRGSYCNVFLPYKGDFLTRRTGASSEFQFRTGKFRSVVDRKRYRRRHPADC